MKEKIPLSIIQKKIGYKFKKTPLLIQSLIHSSYYNEHKTEISGHNERLEFLGDTVLGLVIAEFLYKKMPKEEEGILSFYLSNLVNANSCVDYMKKLQLDEHILLGKGQKKRIEKGKKNITADVFEALIGAIYLDGGLSAVQEFIKKKLLEIIEEKILSPIKNFKTKLQDFTQKKYQNKPRYEILSKEGPSHELVFHVAVFVENKKIGEGKGSSKKYAEQRAAKAALKKLGEDE